MKKNPPSKVFYARAKKISLITGKIVGFILAIYGLFQMIDDIKDRNVEIIVSPQVFKKEHSRAELEEIIVVVNKTNETFYDVNIIADLDESTPDSVRIRINQIEPGDSAKKITDNIRFINDNFATIATTYSNRGPRSQFALKRLLPNQTLRLVLTTENTPVEWGGTYQVKVKIGSYGRSPLNPTSETVDFYQALVNWSAETNDSNLDGRDSTLLNRSCYFAEGLATHGDKAVYGEAHNYLQSLNVEAARKILTEKVKASIPLHLTLANISICCQDYNDALQHIERALTLDPKDQDSLCAAVIVASAAGNHESVKLYYARLSAIPYRPEEVPCGIIRRNCELIYYLSLLQVDSLKISDSFLENKIKNPYSATMAQFYLAARAAKSGRNEEARYFLSRAKANAPPRFWELTISSIIDAGIPVPPDPRWDSILQKISSNRNRG